MGNRLEELMNKLASEKQEEGMMKFSEEDVELLQALGQAYIEGLITGMKKQAEESKVKVVDLDGDGKPDHIVADAEEVVDEIISMVEEGEISPEEAEHLLDIVEAQISDEEPEKTAEELEKKATSILKKVKTGLGHLTGARAGSDIRSKYKVLKDIAAEIPGGRLKRTLVGDAIRDVWYRNKKAILLPIGFYGAVGAGAYFGIKKLRENRKKK